MLTEEYFENDIGQDLEGFIEFYGEETFLVIKILLLEFLCLNFFYY